MPRDAVTIPLAEADVAMVQCFMLFLRGAVGDGWDSIRPIWNELLRMTPGRRVHNRSGARAQSYLLPEEAAEASALFKGAEAGSGCRARNKQKCGC